MNRREALAALVSIPAVASVSVANISPSDVVVIECDEHVSDKQALLFRSYLEAAFPNNKSLVLAGCRLKVVKGLQ
jgi:hypothetical protein